MRLHHQAAVFYDSYADKRHLLNTVKFSNKVLSGFS